MSCCLVNKIPLLFCLSEGYNSLGGNLLEIQEQVSCNDGNINAMQDGLVLSSVEVLENVQRLQRQGKRETS